MQTQWVVRTAGHLKKPLSDGNIMETDLETGSKQYTEVPWISKKTGAGIKSIPEAAEPTNQHSQIFFLQKFFPRMFFTQ